MEFRHQGRAKIERKGGVRTYDLGRYALGASDWLYDTPYMGKLAK